MRAAIVVRSLEVGGSERQAVLTARELARRGHAVALLQFRGGGSLAESLSHSPVQVIDLRQRTRVGIIGAAWRLVRALRAYRADVVMSYLTIPNLVLALLHRFLRPARVVWGLRASGSSTTGYGLIHDLAEGSARRLSTRADLIIVNSRAGFEHYASKGLAQDRMVVVENGIDTDEFRFDPDGRERVRSELGIGPNGYLVGLVARADPVKDHPTFLRAASLIAHHRPDVHFVCVGVTDGPYKSQLLEEAAGLGIADRVSWLPVRADVSAIYSAMDVNTLASVAEGFPNTLLEAMACGTPCVATDVGDVRRILAEVGIVVDPRSPSELASGVLNALGGAVALNDTRARIRSYVEQRYSHTTLGERIETALERVGLGGEV